MGSTKRTVASQLALLPLASVAVSSTVVWVTVSPVKVVVAAMSCVTIGAASQLSVTVASAVRSPRSTEQLASSSRVTGWGQMMTGAVASTGVIAKVQVWALPAASVAVRVMVWATLSWVAGMTVPAAGCCVIVMAAGSEQLSSALACPV